MVAAALGGPMRCERAHRTRERMLLWRSSKMFLPLFPLFFFLSLFHEFFFSLTFLLLFLFVLGNAGLRPAREDRFSRTQAEMLFRRSMEERVTLRHVTSGCCLMAEFRVRLWCFKGWLDGIPTGLRVKLFGSANLFCSSEVWDRLMNEGTWIF